MTFSPVVDTRVFREERRGATVILTPTCDLRELEFDGIEESAEILLDELARGTVKNIVLDFRHTDYYGSTALSFFVKMWKRVKASGGEMAFCNVSAHEREILQITHLSNLWPVAASLEEALEIVGAEDPPREETFAVNKLSP